MEEKLYGPVEDLNLALVSKQMHLYNLHSH